MIAPPFWEKYPREFRVLKGGKKVFSDRTYLNPILNKYAFEAIGHVDRYPRYRNRRTYDPYFLGFCKENKISIPKTYDLPTPNKRASYISLNKYGKITPTLETSDVEKFNLAMEFADQHFGEYIKESRVMDLKETIEMLNLSTSSGPPFSRTSTQKRRVLEEHEAFFHEDWERAAKPGYVHLYGNNLKEEIRLLTKILDNNIRVFAAGGMDGTILGLRLFGNQNKRMVKTHLQHAGCAGLGHLNGAWSRLYKKLSRYKNGFALDVKQWDSSLPAFLFWNVAVIRWRNLSPEFQTKENWSRIQSYYMNLIYSVIVTDDGDIIRKKLGMPSGSATTTYDNTFILYMLLAYAWLITAPDDKKTYYHFNKHVILALQGDDNTWTVSDKAIKWFNARSVAKAFSRVGLRVTTDDWEPRDVIDLDFLSAHFLPYKGGHIPIFGRDKMLVSLMYSDAKNISPSYALERLGGIMQVAWSDIGFRKFLRLYQRWLFKKFDKVMTGDKEWNRAKSTILSDVQYDLLYRGVEHQSVRFCNLAPNKIWCMHVGKKSQGKKKTSRRSVVLNAKARAHLEAISKNERTARKRELRRALERAREQERASEKFLGGAFRGNRTVRNSGNRNPNTRANSSNLISAKKKHTLFNSRGIRRGELHIFYNNKQGYKRAFGNSPSIATGHVHSAEHWEMKQDGQHVTIRSRMMLMTLTTPSTGLSTGERFPYGIMVLNPHNLGGRFKLMADQFVLHKIIGIKLEYVPNVPATDAGSIFVYAPTDPITTTKMIGIDEKAHAATYDNFFAFKVWENKVYNVHPGKVEKGYFDDEADTDARLSTQGVIEVLAGSELEADKTYGTIYAMVEAKFWGKAVENIVPMRTSVELTITWTSFTVSSIANSSVVAYEASPSAGTCSMAALTNEGSALGDDTYVVYGVVDSTSGTFPNWYTADEYGQSGVNSFIPGQGIFIHVRPLLNSGSGTASATLYDQYDAAARSVGGTGSSNPSINGQLVYDGSPSGSLSGSVVFKGYYSVL